MSSATIATNGKFSEPRPATPPAIGHGSIPRSVASLNNSVTVEINEAHDVACDECGAEILDCSVGVILERKSYGLVAYCGAECCQTSRKSLKDKRDWEQRVRDGEEDPFA